MREAQNLAFPTHDGVELVYRHWPAFRVKLYVPFARTGLRLLGAWRGNFFVNSYVKAGLLSHDPARIAAFDKDPLITRAISVNMLLGLDEAAERVVADAQATQIPTQRLISGADWVVRRQPQEQFFQRLGSLRKERHVLPGFFHDTLGERERGHAVARVRRFILHNFELPLSRPALLDADRLGATCAEAEALVAPLPRNSLGELYWRLTRAGLRFGSGLSDGVKLGFASGFDSGSTLDYVYRNQPSGKTGLGRLIDRNYLDSIGWRGIRQRQRHIEELLRLAMAARCTSSTSPPAMAATSSKPSKGWSSSRTRSCCAITARSTCATVAR